MTESQIRKLTSAPTREPTALVDHRKIANLEIDHIESIDRPQVSHKGVLKVNHKGVPMGIPPVLFIGVLKVNIKAVPKEIVTVPTSAKLEPPDPAPTEEEALTRELTSAPTREPPGDPSAPIRVPQRPDIGISNERIRAPWTLLATTGPMNSVNYHRLCQPLWSYLITLHVGHPFHPTSLCTPLAQQGSVIVLGNPAPPGLHASPTSMCQL
jgi:hypothetical protein